MFEIDRDLAEQALDDLPLTDGSRRFAAWWLAQIGPDGLPVPGERAQSIPGDLAASTLTCEVWPWSTVYCRLSGDVIDKVLGVRLAGRDMLALAAPAHRATRLSRYVKVSDGGVLFAHRMLITGDGAKLRVQELLLPHPDRRVTPSEAAGIMCIGFFDTAPHDINQHVLVSRGALDILDEPLFIDLRVPAPVAACA